MKHDYDDGTGFGLSSRTTVTNEGWPWHRPANTMTTKTHLNGGHIHVLVHETPTLVPLSHWIGLPPVALIHYSHLVLTIKTLDSTRTSGSFALQSNLAFLA